jgi:hypothetical protein
VFDVAKQWANILTDEFANQREMEEELKIPTCLFGGPPEPGNIRKLAESQLGFMGVFAMPLFEGVAKLLPGMSFGVEALSKNKAVWAGVVGEEDSEKGPVKVTLAETNSPSETISSRESVISSPVSSTTGQLAQTVTGVTPVVLPLSQKLATTSPSTSPPPSQPLPQPPTRNRSMSPSKKLRKKNPTDATLGRRPSSPTLATARFGGASAAGPNGVGTGNGKVVSSASSGSGAHTSKSNTVRNRIGLGTSKNEIPSGSNTTPKKKKSRRSLWLGEHFSHSAEAVPVPALLTQNYNDQQDEGNESYENGDVRNGEGQGHAVHGWKKLLFKGRRIVGKGNGSSMAVGGGHAGGETTGVVSGAHASHHETKAIDEGSRSKSGSPAVPRKEATTATTANVSTVTTPATAKATSAT